MTPEQRDKIHKLYGPETPVETARYGFWAKRCIIVFAYEPHPNNTAYVLHPDGTILDRWEITR